MTDETIDVALRRVLGKSPLLTEKDIDFMEHVLVAILVTRVVGNIIPVIRETYSRTRIKTIPTITSRLAEVTPCPNMV